MLKFDWILISCAFSVSAVLYLPIYLLTREQSWLQFYIYSTYYSILYLLFLYIVKWKYKYIMQNYMKLIYFCYFVYKTMFFDCGNIAN